MKQSVCVGLALFVGLAPLGSAMAKTHRHRHHVLHTLAAPPPPPPSNTREFNEFSGEFGGYFSTGILPAAEADPYERTGRAYEAPRPHEPGLNMRY